MGKANNVSNQSSVDVGARERPYELRPACQDVYEASILGRQLDPMEKANNVSNQSSVDVGARERPYELRPACQNVYEASILGRQLHPMEKANNVSVQFKVVCRCSGTPIRSPTSSCL